MKRVFILVLISIITCTAYSQDYKDSDYYYYDGLENYKGFSITSDQKSKIISIKKNIGRRHAAIGRDSSIRGAAKGEAHRKLNRQIRQEIYDVLDSSQRGKWDTYRGSRTDWHSNDRIERKIDNIEDQIDDLEDYYEKLIDQVEDNKSLPKDVRKARKNALKAELKSKKRDLKRQKETLKDSRY